MHMHYPARLASLCLTLALVAIVPGHAQFDITPVPTPRSATAVLVITLQNGDGAPVPAQNVKAIIDGETFAGASADDGIAVIAVPAGSGTVSVRGDTKTITLAPATVTRITLTVREVGITLRLQYADGMPVFGSGRAAFRVGDASSDTIGAPLPQQPSIFEFDDVPADATAFAVGITPNTTARRESRFVWTFTDVVAHRALTMTLPSPVPVSIPVQHADGKPWPDIRLTATITLPRDPTPPPSLWEEPPATTQTRTLTLPTRMVNGFGNISIGSWPPGTATVRLQINEPGAMSFAVRDDTGTGSFTVQADGTVTVTPIKLGVGRRSVRQTIFAADGKPAPDVIVNTTFASCGMIRTVTGRTNAAGVVAWPSLPASRVITRVADEPPTVIPEKVTTVTEPGLTLVPDATPVPVTFRISNPYYTTGLIHLRLWTPQGGVQSSDIDARANVEISETGMPILSFTGRCAPGSPFLFVAATNGGTPCAAVVRGFIPFPDDDTPLSLAVQLAYCPAERLTFTANLGDANAPATPITSLQRLTIVPDTLPAWYTPDDTTLSLLRSVGLFTATRDEEGGYTVYRFPSNTAIRICPDLYDVAGDCVTRLDPLGYDGGTPNAVDLGAPLATVPAGAEVYWIDVHRPAEIQRLVVPDGQAVPIFGSAVSTLALWYKTDHGTLMLQHPRAMTAAKEVPLDTPLLSDPPLPAVIPVVAPPNPTDLVPVQQVRLRLQLPQLVAPTGSNRLIARYDVPGGSSSLATPLDNTNAPLPAWAPVGAKTLSLYWPGVGAWENVPLPTLPTSVPYATRQAWLAEAPDAGILVTLPQLVAGPQLTAQLFTADEAPFTGHSVSAAIPVAGADLLRVSIPVPADGKFSIVGLPPGTLFLTAADTRPGAPTAQAGWTLRIPAEGLTGQALHLTPAPWRVFVPEINATVAWWVPDTGDPLCLPRTETDFATYQTPGTPGAVWVVDPETGTAFGTRLIPCDGNTTLTEETPAPGAGFILPYDPLLGLPGSLTLTRLDTGVEMRVTIAHPHWQYYAPTKTLATQLNALPAGHYRITVEGLTVPVSATFTTGERGGMIELPLPVRRTGPLGGE
jgi:hypothetical protein